MAEAVPKAGPAVIVAFILAAITAGADSALLRRAGVISTCSGSSYSYARVAFGDFVGLCRRRLPAAWYALAASSAIGWSGYLNNLSTTPSAGASPRHYAVRCWFAGRRGWRFISTIQPAAGHPRRALRHPSCCAAPRSALVNAGMVLLKLLVLLVFFAVIAWGGFRGENFTPFFNSSGADRCDRRCRHRVLLVYRAEHRSHRRR